MKKIHKILILIIFILLIILIPTIILTKSKQSNQNNNDYELLKEYISIIYGKTFLIPEFDNINNADENWLYENINQYLWTKTEYEEKNNEQYGYTYDEICNILKTLYGSNFTKEIPKDLPTMRYDPDTDKYGPTAYGLEFYYDYAIDNISQKRKYLYCFNL